MPDSRILGQLDISAYEVSEMREEEYRNKLLRQDNPLTDPVIEAVERSVGRERDRIEDVYEPMSGPEKWYDIGNVVVPKWTGVLSELDRRREYANTGSLELTYRNRLSTQVRRADGLMGRLESNPDDRDIVEFVRELRGIEDITDEL